MFFNYYGRILKNYWTPVLLVILTASICVGIILIWQLASATTVFAGVDVQSEEIRAGTVVDAYDLDIIQAAPLSNGDTIVILHTSLGDITLRFFPKETPIAYKNFVTHARNGYYDGVTFHRVIEGFMIQGGDPEGTGMGGESIWGHGFGPEFSPYLRHFRGALAMAQSAMPNSIGSQFYIVQSSELDDNALQTLEFLLDHQDEVLGTDADGNNIYVQEFFPTDKLHAYMRYGGTPHLDLVFSEAGHTVFGQVIDGMDVVDAIATVEIDLNDNLHRPVTEIVIERVTVGVYYEGEYILT